MKLYSKEYYESKCTCGNYSPYEPVGITSMLFPLYSCVSCYHEEMKDKFGEAKVVIISDNLKELINEGYKSISR